MSKYKKINTRKIVLTGLIAALMCIFGPFTLPIGPVPVTLVNFAIYLAIIITGTRVATLSCTVYLLTGLLGLPVFSGFTGGAGVLLSPTGGYLVGYVFMAFVSGIIAGRSSSGTGKITGMIIGTVVMYSLGSIWLALQLNIDFISAIMIGAVPFAIWDIMKIILAVWIGTTIKKRIKI